MNYCLEKFLSLWDTHPLVAGSRAAGAAAPHFYDLRVSHWLMSDYWKNYHPTLQIQGKKVNFVKYEKHGDTQLRQNGGLGARHRPGRGQRGGADAGLHE
jgi:hypothetical protein